MAKTTLTWWHVLVICPSCGSKDLLWPRGAEEKGKCANCARGFKLDNVILRWNNKGKIAKFVLLLVLARKFRSFFNPISCPILPFRYLAQIRLEQYYQRTLSDLDLARKWASHYLGGLDLSKSATVLDFGCGRGRNIGMLNQLGYRVVGQDIKSHQWWRQFANCGFQVMQEGPKLPWRDEGFDIVIEQMVIHYIPEYQLAEHIQEIKRVLKPGGYWLLLETNSKSFGARQMRSMIGRLHELDKIKELTVRSGFLEISQSFEGFCAPCFPIAINFIRKVCSPRKFDISDYNSWLAGKIKPERRTLWLLQLRRVK